MNNQILLLVFVFFAAVSCNNEQPEPAHLQFISMVPSGKTCTVDITPINTTTQKQSYKLNYASPSGYHTFKPGKYDIFYRIAGTTILEGRFVLGKKSYQTLIASGMLPDSLRKNPRTSMNKIKRVFAGSESTDANGYMPQFLMLRDLYRGKKSQGMIRLVNASPFAHSVLLKKGVKKMQTLTYPKYSEPMPVKAGQDTFNFYLGSVRLNRQKISIERGYIHTIITGNKSDTSLAVATYNVKSESIR